MRRSRIELESYAGSLKRVGSVDANHYTNVAFVGVVDSGSQRRDGEVLACCGRLCFMGGYMELVFSN